MINRVVGPNYRSVNAFQLTITVDEDASILHALLGGSMNAATIITSEQSGSREDSNSAVLVREGRGRARRCMLASGSLSDCVSIELCGSSAEPVACDVALGCFLEAKERRWQVRDAHCRKGLLISR